VGGASHLVNELYPRLFVENIPYSIWHIIYMEYHLVNGLYIYNYIYIQYMWYIIYMGYYVDYKQWILSAKPGRATDQFTQALAVSQQMLHGLKNVHLVSTKNRWPSSGYFSPIYGK
jgi:hypothetical protein